MWKKVNIVSWNGRIQTSAVEPGSYKDGKRRDAFIRGDWKTAWTSWIRNGTGFRLKKTCICMSFVLWTIRQTSGSATFRTLWCMQELPFWTHMDLFLPVTRIIPEHQKIFWSKFIMILHHSNGTVIPYKNHGSSMLPISIPPIWNHRSRKHNPISFNASEME